MIGGYMYILLCANGAYYTGSTQHLELRLAQHQNGEGANFTRKHLPVKLVYYETYERIDQAFYREKQVQGWSRKKKEALIKGETNLLHPLSECQNATHYKRLTETETLGTSAPLSDLDYKLSVAETEGRIIEVTDDIAEATNAIGEIENDSATE
jgi:putative endonuclease